MKPVDDRASIEEALVRYYGVPPHVVDHLAFVESEGDRLYAATPEAGGIDGTAAGARVERVGMYFGTWTDRGLRLGFEGAEVVAEAAEPVVELDGDEARAWLAGEDLPLHGTFRQPFVILTWGEMVLGCGLALGEAVRNRVPKARRIARDAVVLDG